MADLPGSARSRPLAAALCMGYGGIDLALESVLDVELAWCSEIDTNVSRVIDARFPDVTNFGDIRRIDWADVPAVDVLTAGYPCQPFSHAGRRQGTNDERHLWPFIADAIGVLRPGLVVLENVAGHLSLGLDRVTADLAALGYVGRAGVVRASDVGACHRRARVFIVAADASDERRERHGDPWGRWTRPTYDDRSAADADRGRLQERSEQDGGPSEPGLGAPRRRDVDGRRADDADTDRSRLEGREPAQGRDVRAWGDYEDAIRCHERSLGRRAPDPVDDAGRLNPRFVEWMMMLPEGWVTDVLTTRTAALKALGNGVVPPQAEYAVSALLAGANRAAEVAA